MLVSVFEKFNPLNVSSKFAICGLPIRVDTYKTCSFQCKYCFSNCRKVMEFEKTLKIGDIDSVERTLDRIYNRNEIDSSDLLDVLVSNNITWHCGGMSDPFQPIESKLNITKQLLDVTNKYRIHILFSTKSDAVYNCDIRNDLHTFQLSVSNIDDRTDIEPNVPSIEERYKFYRRLKGNGFKVGIRIQPFIPNISSLDIVKLFHDADNFTLEGIKIVPQNEEHKKFILDITGLDISQFLQMGLLNLHPEIRLELYKPFMEYFEEKNIPYSIADNDLRKFTKNKCCCGDNLVNKSTDFNTTAMIYKYGEKYNKQQLLYEINTCNIGECKCNYLFTSNRQEGCITVKDFFNKRFNRVSSPFSPKYQYNTNVRRNELF